MFIMYLWGYPIFNLKTGVIRNIIIIIQENGGPGPNIN